MKSKAELVRTFTCSNRTLLTGLPDALWCRKGVAEDAFMPEASKAMDHLSSPVQNHTLHLVLTVFWTPVSRLEYKEERLNRSTGMCRMLTFHWLSSERQRLAWPWRRWSCRCRRRSLCFWWPPHHSVLTSAPDSAHCGYTSLPCSIHSDPHTFTHKTVQ